MLDANIGILQLLPGSPAGIADGTIVSTGTACGHWKTHRYQGQIPGIQIHADQQAAGARLPISS